MNKDQKELYNQSENIRKLINEFKFDLSKTGKYNLSLMMEIFDAQMFLIQLLMIYLKKYFTNLLNNITHTRTEII
jgi:hypothetical protein